MFDPYLINLKHCFFFPNKHLKPYIFFCVYFGELTVILYHSQFPFLTHELLSIIFLNV